ncbi:MAG: hypothetical protein SCARUB_03990 [Candidatus Scalindua rubra]|uniref:Uncharacterized protein n=1 Tax=Candidatus Scalindua rubra TaxID=1872076 RepID=A0A1E3X5C9_9BACT|nr:MAG: hypothetical protein SCARUB_03990 [Candidatus Scalindua rubra]
MKNIKYITAGLLLLAVLPLPYAYYTLLRWVVTAVSGYCAFLSYEDKSMGWAFGFGIIAILFNPIVPFYMDKTSWMIFDSVVAGVFGFNAFVSEA